MVVLESQDRQLRAGPEDAVDRPWVVPRRREPILNQANIVPAAPDADQPLRIS